MGTPTVTPLLEIWHDGGFIVSESNGHQSRDQITLAGGRRVLAGEVLGFSSASVPASATSTTGSNNVGGGTLIIGTQPVSNTPAGTYTITLNDSDTFNVSGPQGFSLQNQPTGTAITVGDMVFTVDNVGDEFEAGDSFTIVVKAASSAGSLAPLNPTATDGTQTAAGILFGTRDTTNGSVEAVVIRRNAEVNASELIWPEDATPAQIATATGQLEQVGVLLR